MLSRLSRVLCVDASNDHALSRERREPGPDSPPAPRAARRLQRDVRPPSNPVGWAAFHAPRDKAH